MTDQTLQDITDGYIECALWTEQDDLSSDAELHPDTINTMEDHCRSFWASIVAAGLDDKLPDDYSPQQLGHDFWLTRNGHGAGFWDRDELARDGLGDQLTELAQQAGEVWLYQGDDALIYIQ